MRTWICFGTTWVLVKAGEPKIPVDLFRFAYGIHDPYGVTHWLGRWAI